MGCCEWEPMDHRRRMDRHTRTSYSPSIFPICSLFSPWTCSLLQYDCAKYLNGRGVDARYDGSYPGSTKHGVCSPFTGPTSAFPDYYKTFMRQYYEAQTSSFEGAQGWIFWNWKVRYSLMGRL